MGVWQSILTALGGNAALFAALIFVGKKFLESQLKKNVVKFESDLRAKADITLERIKNDAQIAAFEHQIRFSKFHEKRAEVIAELSALLAEASWTEEYLFAPIGDATVEDRSARFEEAWKKLIEFNRYFDRNRAYLPEKVCASIEQLTRKMRDQMVKFQILVVGQRQGGWPKASAWEEAWKTIQDEVPQARRCLENEFRSILGDKA